MVDKDEVKRVFSLSRQDIYFIIIIVMLGVVMGFNFSLVEPVRDIQERMEHDQNVEMAKLIEAIRDTHNNSLPDAEGAVCSVACLPSNYTLSNSSLANLTG